MTEPQQIVEAMARAAPGSRPLDPGTPGAGTGASGAGKGGSGAGGGGGTGDPLLDALIAKLPPAGQTWSVEERVAWLSLMAMGFQITYGVQPNIDIKPAS